MKLLLLMCALLVSSVAMAQDINATIADIEHNNSAKCYELNRSTKFCLNYSCVNFVKFQCIDSRVGQHEDFKVKLMVLTNQLGDGTYIEKVKKVKYIK